MGAVGCWLNTPVTSMSLFVVVPRLLIRPFYFVKDFENGFFKLFFSFKEKNGRQ
jgi:hypothetical protein